MFVHRTITSYLDKLGQYYPIISLTGPRQAGKTTLLRELYKDYRYVSFEAPETRADFTQDPRGFLRAYDDRVIFDEAQHVPELFSYLQLLVDEDRRPGRFILSGSQNFLLLKSITQSLAGRVGIARLLPFDHAEKRAVGVLPTDYLTEILNGGYPAKIVQDEPADIFYSNYIASYVQRDVSGLISPANMTTFQRFLSVCAGYAGQLLNYSKMALAVGVSVPTIQSWLSILEQSYLVFRLPPFYRNIKKRLVKSPKLYFYDTGLACYLLRIREENALRTYYQFGGLFENMLIADAYKSAHHAGHDPWYAFYRDKSAQEVDLVYDAPGKLTFWEIKATETYHPNLTKSLKQVADHFAEAVDLRLLYGGEKEAEADGVKVAPWHAAHWSL